MTLIYEIKKHCEEVAQGNNGRIRPCLLLVNVDLHYQFEEEMTSLKKRHWEAELTKGSLSPVRLHWDPWEWREFVGPPQRKTYEIPFFFDDDLERKFETKLECNQCENEPLQARGEYYCPVCE